jgi:Dolichyl-phosphate-mannose-protein mannosyltransferase
MSNIFNIKEKKVIVLGLLLFLVIRLTNLTILPIFTDEAIYIRWSEITMHANFSKVFADPNNLPENEKLTTINFLGQKVVLRNPEVNKARTDLFIPLSDGKQPLFMWLATIPMWLNSDHLFAGRLPSVLSGLAAIVGIWLLTYELFKKKSLAHISALVYLICPFTLMYDRLMLADSMLAMWGIYAIYFNIRLAKHPSIKNAIILGTIYGLGLLTKSPALFYFLLAPLSLLFFGAISDNGKLNIDQIKFWKWGTSLWKKFAQWTGLWLLAVLIGQAFQAILRLSNMYHMIGRKNLEFIITSQEFFANPFGLLLGNMTGMTTWFIVYLGWPFVFCFVVGLAVALYRKDIRILYLFLLAILPWVASASFNKVLYPRYLLFFTPQLLIIIGYGIYEINKFVLSKLTTTQLNLKWGIIAVLNLAISSYALYSSSMILFNPPKALLPLQDREQYIVGWPSGYGVNEITEFLKKEYKDKGKIAVGTEGTFGLMPFALQIMFYDEIYNTPGSNEKIFIDGYWPFDKVHQQIVEYAAGRPTYFVVYQTEKEPPAEFPLELVMKIPKPDGKSSMRLYKVTPVWRYTPEGVIKN